MKTFFSDIFPKIQRFSEKLDNITLLTNQHWVSIDDLSSAKTVYIFRSNNELLIATNGKVEKEKWEYLGNKSLLIDKKTESYLFKHGFFDENILALKVDSSEQYAVFVNENKYEGELDSIDRVFDFLKHKYLNPTIKSTIESTTGKQINSIDNKQEVSFVEYETDKGIVLLERFINMTGTKAFQDGKPAPDGRYKLGFWDYFEVTDGIITKS